MKKSLLVLLSILAFIFSSQAIAQDHKCSTMLYLSKQIAKDPGLAERMKKSEVEKQKWISTHAKSTRGGALVITIPVVFHVIWNDPIENISDNQIYSQLDILNEDFRALNADTLDDTHPFWQYTADAEIEFCLAAVDENGDPTDGITRTQTNVVTWDDAIQDDIKSTANGGLDNWDPTQYLNIYVVNLGGTTLGFATFPDDLAATPEMDGVVIRYEAFGNTGTAGIGAFQANDLGRTATHEVGHWLDLRHIWGDTICGDDFVTDTEIAETSNFGCPAFPFNDNSTCGSGPDGEMYMNYMDYVDDACMNMFTTGQADRMYAALNGPRSGLLTSTGCDAASALTKNFNEKSIEIFPNPNNGNFSLHVKNPAILSYTVDIYNILGACIKRLELRNLGNTQISMNEFGCGSYYLKITTNNKTVTKKIFVTK